MTIAAWLDQTTTYLIDTWGLSDAFAFDVAVMLYFFAIHNLHPTITSGWRSPEKQAELLRRYESGDPGVVARPALRSLHLNTVLGRPASLAIDVATSNHALAAQIARALGIRAGAYFTRPDPVHFDAGLGQTGG